MALSSVEEAGQLVVKELLPAWRCERERLNEIDCWYRWEHEDIKLPHRASTELRELIKLSKVPWLSLVVTSTAQCMYVDGYRSELDQPGAPSDVVPMERPTAPWRIWKSNGMDNRQIAIHRATLAYGYSYVTVLPGEDFLGEAMPVIRGVSPRKMWAAYEDPCVDEWPRYAIQVEGKLEDLSHQVKLYDDQGIWTLRINSGNPVDGERPYTLLDYQSHDVGFCPVVRFCNQMDLDGRTPGEVEPHIALARRINKTSYDRMLTQHFNSWKVRTIAGLSAPDPEDDQVTESAILAREKLRLRQDDILIAEDHDTKFGTLPETPLEGFIHAWRADIESLAAVTQTPTHELTGQLVNVSAEGLAMIRAAQMQKVAERKSSFGHSYVQTLRLACAISGSGDYARDITGRVTWQDTSIRSMAQAVDALGKMATMLRVPVTELWGRVPGVEKSDVEEWKQVAEADDPINRMHDELSRQSQPETADRGLD